MRQRTFQTLRSMREIKFRAWDKQDEEWVYAEPVYGFFPSIIINDDTPDRYGDIQQYTGLKDKNGKEIYEGDIMRSPSGSKANAGIGVVEYVTANQFGVPMMRYWVKVNEDEAWTITERDEVIGNIYENPDLV